MTADSSKTASQDSGLPRPRIVGPAGGTISIIAAVFLTSLPAGPSRAATIAPPMLDITRQCDAVSRHNATAMSECVVAESEARAELLQKWSKLSDKAVVKCVKLGRRARREPYATIAKCVAAEEASANATPAKPVVPAAR